MRVDTVLRTLDVPATPSAEFSESLYQHVAPLAIAAGRRDRTWYGSIVATLRSRRIGFGVRPPIALTRTVAFLVLLALVLLVVALIGSRRPDPNQLVQMSELVYVDPPAFDMTVAYENGDVRRFRYDGVATMRLDVATGSYVDRQAGAYILTDVAQNQRAEWDPISGTTSAFDLPAGLLPLHELDLRWGTSYLKTWNHLNETPCGSWEDLGDELVAGRATRHLVCTTRTTIEFWIDESTGFVLRSTDVPTETDRIEGEVQAIALGAVSDPSVFRFNEDDPRFGALMPGNDEPFDAGTRVVSARFEPAFAATPGEGWRSWGSGPNEVGFVRGADFEDGTDGAGVFVVRPLAVTDVATGRDVPLAPGADTMINWLRGHPYFEVGNVETAQIGSVSAQSMSLRLVLPDDFDTTCPVPAPQQPVPPCRRWFRATDYWTLEGLDPAIATALEVDGTTLLILAWADGPNAAAHMAAVNALLATVEFLK